jgi:hypothetical protein
MAQLSQVMPDYHGRGGGPRFIISIDYGTTYTGKNVLTMMVKEFPYLSK